MQQQGETCSSKVTIKQIQTEAAFSFRLLRRQEGEMTSPRRVTHAHEAEIYQISLTSSVFKLYQPSEIK